MKRRRKRKRGRMRWHRLVSSAWLEVLAFGFGLNFKLCLEI